MKAVIMAGGQGTRFWPLSRERSPKQFLKLCGGRTLLQETAARLEPLLKTEDLFVVCSGPYVEQVRAQLPELTEEQIIREPLARNTAPCVGLSALYLRHRYPGEIVAMLPADHVIQDVAGFQGMLRSAAELAGQGWLVTFGIQPSHPATGYGYLKRGEPVGEFAGHPACRVEQFTEKPDLETARRFVEGGDHSWNSGMFVWSVDVILEEIERCMPRLHEALMEIDRSWEEPERVQEIFSHVEKVSIDFGVMEKARKVAMLPCRLGWSDVGNWKALQDIWPGDAQGLVANGRYIAIDSANSVVYAADRKVVALVGIEGLVVVETPDALLICDGERTEEVRKVVERLKARGLEEYL